MNGDEFQFLSELENGQVSDAQRIGQKRKMGQNTAQMDHINSYSNTPSHKVVNEKVLENMRVKKTFPAMGNDSLYGVDPKRKGGRPKGKIAPRSEQEKKEHRKQLNRRNAAKSRLRKKFNIEETVIQLACLKEENEKLKKKYASLSSDKQLDRQHVLNDAVQVLENKTNDKPTVGKEAMNVHDNFDLWKTEGNESSCFIMTNPTKPDNPIEFATPEFYELTGYSPHDIIGKNARLFQGEFTNRDTVKIIREAIEKKSPVFAKLINYKKDGTPFWIQLHLAPVMNSENTITKWIGIVKPINVEVLMKSAGISEKDLEECFDDPDALTDETLSHLFAPASTSDFGLDTYMNNVPVVNGGLEMNAQKLLQQINQVQSTSNFAQPLEVHNKVSDDLLLETFSSLT